MEGPPYNECRREGKAEIHARRLDRSGASPHGLGMTGGTTDEPKAGKGRPAPSPSRENRLAEALRANLRRRKAPAAPAAADPAPPNRSHTGPKDPV